MKLYGGGEGGARGNEKREGVVGWAGINQIKSNQIKLYIQPQTIHVKMD